uniref:Mitochondrial fission process protein 1 n=1 Tax=Photinus pyralis TaxID=7054 RepID=A0A1Y1KBC9_PHOPY
MSHSGEIDIYRDTPIRYLGYANEIGEAFRSMIGPKWVAVTYGVATTYVLADTASKTKDAHVTPIFSFKRYHATEFSDTAPRRSEDGELRRVRHVRVADARLRRRAGHYD